MRDRCLRCPIYRQSQLDIGKTEDHCARQDKIAAEDHFSRLENTWDLVLNSSGPNGPMNQREDHQEAIRIKERLYQESGHANPRHHPREQVRQRPDQPFAWHDEGSEPVDPKTGWRWYDTKPSPSSSSSGWHPSSWWQSSSWSQTSRWCERFFHKSRCCAAGNGDSLVSGGECEHYTQPTDTSHSRTRDFSPVAQDLGHRVRIHSVSPNSHSSHLALPHAPQSDLLLDHLPDLY